MMPRNPRRAAAGGVVVTAFALAGCAATVVGHWRLERASPGRDVFSLDNAHFRGDGTYEATLTLEGKTVREAGAYTFDGFTLTLRPAAGGYRKFDASASLDRLELRTRGRLVILEKGKP
jgi:hypothetical protein